jgi:hypothetical protein
MFALGKNVLERIFVKKKTRAALVSSVVGIVVVSFIISKLNEVCIWIKYFCISWLIVKFEEGRLTRSLSNIASSSHSPKEPYTDAMSSIRLSCWSHTSNWLLSTVASFVKYNHTHHMNSSLRRKQLVDTCTPHRRCLYSIARWNQG